MNGPGPQMNACRSVNGAASCDSAFADGNPCSDSSQCTTVSRSGYLAASSRSASAKITDRSSRLAYSSTTWPPPSDNADLQIDMIGVIPLPAASSTKSLSRVLGTKVPDGAST